MSQVSDTATVWRVIDKSEIDVKVYRDETEDIDSAVRLTHKPTGITVESWDHNTQVATTTQR